MKHLKTIGVITFLLGIGAGDSENLLIPLALLVAGVIMVKVGAAWTH